MRKKVKEAFSKKAGMVDREKEGDANSQKNVPCLI